MDITLKGMGLSNVNPHGHRAEDESGASRLIEAGSLSREQVLGSIVESPKEDGENRHILKFGRKMQNVISPMVS